MQPESKQIAFEFLLHGSKMSLQDAKLSRLADVSNRRKQIVELLDEWAERRAEALLFEWFLTHGNELMAAVTMPSTITTIEPMRLPSAPGPISALELRERLQCLLNSA